MLIMLIEELIVDGRIILKGIICEGMNWIHADRDRDKWQAGNVLVNLVANKKETNFLTYPVSRN
jgi:hypothetical protein